jgi:hypothetical protein
LRPLFEAKAGQEKIINIYQKVFSGQNFCSQESLIFFPIFKK